MLRDGDRALWAKIGEIVIITKDNHDRGALTNVCEVRLAKTGVSVVVPTSELKALEQEPEQE